jgi:hypothetical protein
MKSFEKKDYLGYYLYIKESIPFPETKTLDSSENFKY